MSFESLADAIRRQLLVKRVLTVSELRCEMSARWRNERSVEAPSKAIPVPLYHGETMEQYTRKFEQWLQERHESLESLRSDPPRERGFWFSFAQLRVGTIDTVMASIGRNKDSRKRDFCDSNYKAAFERKRQRYDEGSALPEHSSSGEGMNNVNEKVGVETNLRDTSNGVGHVPSPPRTREELLAQRIVTPEEYLLEVMERRLNRTPREIRQKLKEIPVPMHPGETLHEYEKEFRLWVYQHHQSMASLRSNPAKERGFRCQFALEKAKASQQPTRRSTELTKQDFIPALVDDECGIQAGDGDLVAASSQECSIATVAGAGGHKGSHQLDRSEIAEDKGHIQEDEGEHSGLRTPENAPSQYIDFKENAQKADAILSTRSLPSVQVSPASLEHEASDKELATVDTSVDLSNDLSSTCHSEDSDTNVVASSESYQDQAATVVPEGAPSWALVLINRLHELETKVASLERKIGAYGAADDETEKDPPDAITCAKKARSSSDVDASQASVADAPCQRSVVFDSGDGSGSNGRPKCVGLPARVLFEDSDSHREDAPSIRIRVEDDPEIQRLTAVYDQLNSKIITNETAIADARAYMEADKAVDEVITKERQIQIMELAVFINKEKVRRTVALADLIIYTWAGQKEKLMSILEGEPSAEAKSRAKHETCAEIATRIGEKDGELKRLKMQLDDLKRMIKPSVTRAGRVLRLKTLRKLSDVITTQQAAKESLEKEHQEVVMSFVQGDEEVRKLVKASQLNNGG